MWIVRASLTILAIKFTLSHTKHTRTLTQNSTQPAHAWHDHKHTQTQAIQNGKEEEEKKTWKSQITHLRLCRNGKQQQPEQPKQQTARKRNTNEKKQTWRVRVQTQENGKTTTHRNTHNIKFNIKLYINKMMDNGKEEAKTRKKKKQKKQKIFKSKLFNLVFKGN